FAAIAGTYTPLSLRMPNGTGTLLCLGVWLLAAAGAALKLAAPRRYERLGLAVYLGLGWIGLPAAPILAEALRPETIRLIALGGLLYTLGAGVQL
ncbi:hemolysin III family protein, partial [bacterium]|nr:hemolysin III family protein [bacterium]